MGEEINTACETAEWLLLRYSDRYALDHADHVQCPMGTDDVVARHPVLNLQVLCVGKKTAAHAGKGSRDIVHVRKPLLQLTNASVAPLLKGPLGNCGLRDTPMNRVSLYVNLASWLLGYDLVRGHLRAGIGVPKLFMWSARRSGYAGPAVLETADWRPDYIEKWLAHVREHPDFGTDHPAWKTRLVDFGRQGGLRSVLTGPQRRRQQEAVAAAFNF